MRIARVSSVWMREELLSHIWASSELVNQFLSNDDGTIIDITILTDDKPKKKKRNNEWDALNASREETKLLEELTEAGEET